ncbi:MAG: hypothetical protein J6Y02_20610 [Pseudobutyrivibrio sp.]|nr:hypothetical protein [Pseudobutyrivibrio sp.]
MDGQTTFLDEFNATAPDLSREVNVMVYGGSTPGPTPDQHPIIIQQNIIDVTWEGE